MSAHSRRRFSPAIRMIAGCAAVTALVGVGSSPVAAQDFFLFTPRVTLGVHGGFNVARAGSEVFDFTSDNLTVESSDFSSPAIRAELAVRLTERVDVSVDVAWMATDVRSESRDFIGTDDLPILQTTEFSQTPITFNLKYYLKDRGQQIGSFAWVPAKIVPYLGSGVGIVRYSFVQSGEFVVEETLEIVNARFDSATQGRLFHIMGGAEYALTKNALVVLDGRYRWASAQMRNDWVDFDDIDLSGLSFSLGLAVRF